MIQNILETCNLFPSLKYLGTETISDVLSLYFKLKYLNDEPAF